MSREMQEFVIDRIPTQCSQGPFWGNGEMGAVLYVQGNALCFSVDHTSLWEMRETLPDEPRADFATILQHKKEYLSADERYAAPTNIFENAIGRVKLPGLGVSLVLPKRVVSFCSRTNLALAASDIEMELQDGTLCANILLDSCANVLRLELRGEGAEQAQLRAEGWHTEHPALRVLAGWNYPPCEKKEQEGSFVMTQGFSGENTAVLCARIRRKTGSLTALVSIATGPAKNQLALATQQEAFLAQYEQQAQTRLQAHRADWQSFWAGFDVVVPTPRLQHCFDLEMYKLYCNERETSSPVTLQGVWNPDNRMPAWFGDLHNDLNVQACYWAAFRTGNARLARPYIEYYTRAIPRFRQRAEKLFGVADAIHVPVMMAPSGYGAASEWCYWNTCLGPELFVATDFCWYYEYTQDVQMLKTHILPFLQGVATLYRALAQPGQDGYLHIPFMQSPEYDGPDGMVMQDDATFALAALRYLLEKLCQYSALIEQPAEQWNDFAEKLAPVVAEENGYPLFPGMKLAHSHRHFCHMYPIFPLGVDAHSTVAHRTLDAAVDNGFTEFAAFSFPYLAIFAARCGRGNMCRTLLEIYCMAFRSRNSFTVNGDPYRNGILKIASTNAGESDDSFTLESGLMVPAALCEMMAHHAAGVLWLGFGIPDDWKTCSCHGLAVQGGHKISLRWEGYRLAGAQIVPNATQKLLVALPAGNTAVGFSGAHATPCPLPEGTALAEQDSRAFRVSLTRGETVQIECE